MAGVTGVLDDPPRFPQAPLPVDVLEGGKLTSNYLFRAPHYSLKSFAVVGGAVAIPGGDDIILPCQLEPARDAVDLTVEWSRRDLKPRFVHLKRDDAELVTQNTLYSRRTSLSVNKLKCGDISLKLSKVQVSDAGTYSCLVPEIGAKSGMELVIVTFSQIFFVGSVSSVVMEISKVKNEIFFKCKSNGWYPEPRVFWLNSQGKQITAESTNSAKGSDGLYTVSSTVTVNKRQTYSLTCRVQQKNINQTEEAHIHVSGRKNTCLCS
uniref:Ig-like domain-containing protein n=1 Tax=Maylandia zebra TaxID=106582 RepID=A0A3P9CNT5_9CICH